MADMLIRRLDGKTACMLLTELQAEHPHLRVGQIIDNAVSIARQQGLDGFDHEPDLFYLENDRLVAALKYFQLWMRKPPEDR